jgi:hypothetical protein
VVAKSVKAVTKPFKKLKRTLTSDTLSSAPDPDTSNVDLRASSIAPDEVISISDDDSPDPEKELGASHYSHIFLEGLLYFRVAEAYLAIPYI